MMALSIKWAGSFRFKKKLLPCKHTKFDNPAPTKKKKKKKKKKKSVHNFFPPPIWNPVHEHGRVFIEKNMNLSIGSTKSYTINNNVIIHLTFTIKSEKLARVTMIIMRCFAVCNFALLHVERHTPYLFNKYIDTKFDMS
jgi:hypothetical protein